MKFDESLFDKLTRSHPGLMIRAEFDAGSAQRLIITMAGYLDANNSGAFTEAMNGVIDAYGGLLLIVFDLERLTYISSTGIGAFANVLIRAKQKGIVLSLVKLGQNVRAVFDVLGISGFFSIAGSLDEALSGTPSPKYDLENDT
jgi:anti-anti-sigma factor